MKYKWIVFILLVPAIGCSSINSSADSKSENPVNGNVTLKIVDIKGLHQNGQPDPSADEACQNHFGNLMGTEIDTSYKINTSTLIMSATSTLLGDSVALNPMGIEGSYDFISDSLPPDIKSRGIRSIYFYLQTDFKSSQSKLLATLNETTNCMLSS